MTQLYDGIANNTTWLNAALKSTLWTLSRNFKTTIVVGQDSKCESFSDHY